MFKTFKPTVCNKTVLNGFVQYNILLPHHINYLVFYACLCAVLCVCFCTGHFVMVPLNLTCQHCLTHSVFENLFNLCFAPRTTSLCSHIFLVLRDHGVYMNVVYI